MVGHLEVPETPNPMLSLSLQGFKRLAVLNRDSRPATLWGRNSRSPALAST